MKYRQRNHSTRRHTGRRRRNYALQMIHDIICLILISITLGVTLVGSIMAVSTSRAKAIDPRPSNIEPVRTINAEPIISHTYATPDEVEAPEVPKEDLVLEMADLGVSVIDVGDGTVLTRYPLPDEMYDKDIDFSYFQPYMSYRMITNEGAPAYAIVNSESVYTDENGLRRYKVNDSEFSLGEDDYVVALGTFYKEKGVVGTRYLIITTTGAYTCITGDEKDDRHTDEYHMFSTHCDGQYAGLIEWIVDTDLIPSAVKAYGSVNHVDVPALQGEILQIYRIS